MWANRLTRKYRDGIEEFLSFAESHMKNDKIRCPCVDCEIIDLIQLMKLKDTCLRVGLFVRTKRGIYTVKCVLIHHRPTKRKMLLLTKL